MNKTRFHWLIYISLHAFMTFNGSPLFGQDHKTLLVVDYSTIDSGLRKTYDLYSYSYNNGMLISYELLMSIDEDLAKIDFIYRNRYAVTRSTAIIDLQEKRVVKEPNEYHRFYDTIQNEILFKHIWPYEIKNKLLIYDLDKNRLRKKRKPYFKLEGLHSPDHQHGIEIAHENKLYSIKNDVETMHIDSLAPTVIRHWTMTFPSITTFWVDNLHFVCASYFPYHSQRRILSGDTSISEVEIRMVNIENMRSWVVARIDSVPPETLNPKFSIDPAGNLIFHSDKDNYLIDLEQMVAIPYRRQPLGHDFYLSFPIKPYHNVELEYMGNALKQFELLYSIECTAGYLALQPPTNANFLHHKDEVWIWNTFTNYWQNIKPVHNTLKIIGWIN